MGDVCSQVFETPDDNLESFSLVWFDAQVNKTKENLKAQKKLRQIINHLKTFDDQNLCEQYILSMSPQDRLVLIVSGQCGQQLIPRIHELQQLSSIYVYCLDKQTNQKWADNFTKVKCVMTKLDDLITQIKQDQKNRVKIEEPLSINIFTVSDNPDQSTTRLNGHFLHSLLLIDVLIRMKSIDTDKQQLISLCKLYYEKNYSQLSLVREFERGYAEDKALWWYTRNSFLYKILNKALRVQNIDLLFLFRFVIGDIYRQLKQNQCETFVRVYRGQVMSDDELNLLRRSLNEFISINSFFSTSLDRPKAIMFLSNSHVSTDLHRVLFDIDADPHLVKSKPFADITSFSDFVNEREVLFMIGSVFRLVKIHREANEQIWVIKMKLCDDDEHDLKKLFDHMKKEYESADNEVNLRSFGDAVRQMGKYDLAEKIYRRLLNELPGNDPSRCDLYYSLGMVTKDKRDYDASLQWFEKILKIKMQTDPSNYISIGGTYTSIGLIHWLKGDGETAMEYYNKAITFFQQAHDNHIDTAYLYNNIAVIYDNREKYTEALEYHKKSLDIREKHLPSDYPTIATSYHNIGNVYAKLGQYDLAMQHCEQALKIRRNSLPSQHPHIAMSYKNIGRVYERQEEWKQALIYYQKAANMYRHSLLAQHPDVIEIEEDIQRVLSILN